MMLAHVGDEVAHAAGRDVADGVADAEARGAALDGGREERAERLGARRGGVLGHVHDRQAVLDGVGRRPPR